MKTHVLLVLMAFGCSPVKAEGRSASWPLEIEGPAVHKCLRTDEISPNPATYWWVSGLGENDADGNESLDSVAELVRIERVCQRSNESGSEGR